MIHNLRNIRKFCQSQWFGIIILIYGESSGALGVLEQKHLDANKTFTENYAKFKKNYGDLQKEYMTTIQENGDKYKALNDLYTVPPLKFDKSQKLTFS